MRKYWYSIFLICSIAVMVTVNLLPYRHSAPSAAQEYVREKPIEETVEDMVTENQSQGQNEAIKNTQVSSEAAETVTAVHTTEQEQDKTGIHKDFSDTLFIGDSRTVGLSEYGDLGQAVVFADSGMSVFNLLDAQVSLGNGDKQKLEQVLLSENFKTIYLMLGINELGYDLQSIISQYRKVVDWIHAKQPEAALVLEANLHVTEEKSAKSDIYNNQRINALNNAIKNIAEDTGC